MTQRRAETSPVEQSGEQGIAPEVPLPSSWPGKDMGMEKGVGEGGAGMPCLGGRWRGLSCVHSPVSPPVEPSVTLCWLRPSLYFVVRVMFKAWAPLWSSWVSDSVG